MGQRLWPNFVGRSVSVQEAKGVCMGLARIGRRRYLARAVRMIEVLESRRMLSGGGSALVEGMTPIAPMASLIPGDIGGLTSNLSGGGTGAGGLPLLSSRPLAGKKIYLNFLGDNVGTWNGKHPGQVLPYSLDSDSSTFSPAEQAAITEVFNRVAEMYSPFDIDVTTIDPQSYPVGVVAKAEIIGNDDWYQDAGHRVAGGVALVDGFSIDSGEASNYAWIFAGLQGAAKNIALTVSHEVGHLFGLEHHPQYGPTGARLSDYNAGDALKGPIMGAPFSAARGLWYNAPGDVSFLSNQDDLSVLASNRNGFGFRADDYGDSPATAGAFDPSRTMFPSSLLADGVITTNTDQDYFQFASHAGAVQFSVTVAAVGPMLDASLKIMDASGNLVAQVATAALNERLDATLPSDGTYYVVVSGASGNGDVGTYTLAGSIDAVGLVSDAGGPYTVAEGGTVTFSGAASTGSISTYEWDTDYTGVFHPTLTGVSPRFPAGAADGPSTRTIGLRITTAGGLVAFGTTTLSITNVAPSGTAAASGLGEGSTTAQIIVTAKDPSAVDQASLRYSYDFNGDGAYDLINSPDKQVPIPVSFLSDGPYSHPATVRIEDKDGAFVLTTVPISFNNSAPTGTVFSPFSVSEAEQATIGLTNVVDGAADLSAGLKYSFDFNGDGNYDIVDSSSPQATTPAGSLDGNSVVTFRVKVADKDGGSTVYTKTFNVTNTAPSVSISAGGTVISASAVSFSSSVSEPSDADRTAGFTYLWQMLQGSVSLASAATPNWQFTAVTPGDYIIKLTVKDKNGGSTSASTSLTITEPPPPVLAISAPATIVEAAGAQVTFTLSLSTSPIHTVTVPYTLAGLGGLALLSPLTGTLVFTPGQTQGLIKATLVNDNVRTDNESVQLTLGAVVNANAPTTTASVPVQDDDLLVSGISKGAITITGTAGNDLVSIEPGLKKNYVSVKMRGVIVATIFSPTRILADLGAGNDTLSISTKLKLPSLVFGGDGDDSLVGAGGKDILIGGAGKDYLSGGAGENLLITDGVAFLPGSAGADRLYASWNSTVKLANRVKALRAPGGALVESLVARDTDRDQVDVGGTNDSILLSSTDQAIARKKFKIGYIT